ncbi:MAG: glycogen synthase GlgA [Planctomycetota bacterium]|jgi:starch synthase
MQVLMVASEVAPFSKEGGLADVLGALPAAVARLGHDVAVVSPLYRGVRQRAAEVGSPLKPVDGGAFTVAIGDAGVPAAVWQSATPDGEVTLYFLENDRYYDRDGYYTRPSDNAEYQDNSERFIFLSRGALEMCKVLGLAPQIIHCHDWPTGLVPIYVRHVYDEDLSEVATVFTIHNIAYQGLFWHWDMKLAGLPWSLFTWKMLEYYGNLSFLKGGLVGADALTTVSKTYSREIQTEEHGRGMHGVLQERAPDLYGIVNGIDNDVWNPATDSRIPANYSAEDLSGKARCKEVLQERFGLPTRPEVPLIGMVCRLVDQKGLDLLREALPGLLEGDIQFVVLGRGDPEHHGFLSRMQSARPDAFGVLLAYSDEVAHLVEAGSDMFLMPSRFEPCGLNQLYSLAYGTVPVVRETGGLADTVTDYSDERLRSGIATGFTFGPYEARALAEALGRALGVYADGDRWRCLMLNGMAQDWSWERSAREYVEVYQEALRKVSGQLHAERQGADR